MAQQTKTLSSPSRIEHLEEPFSRSFNLRKRPRIRERFIQAFLFLCGAVSILTTVGIVYELGKESLNFFTRQLWEQTNKSLEVSVNSSATEMVISTTGFALEVGEMIQIGDEAMRISAINGPTITVERGLQGTQIQSHRIGEEIFAANQVSLVEFFTKTRWDPQIGHFGIWPLLNSTLMTSTIAMLVALPLGLSVAIYLSEYASSRARKILKPTLEILAGIPTVVYGYFALTFMTPLLRAILGKGTVEIYNTASAGIVIGILVIPLVSSMSEEALSAVPRSLRQASYGLGATKLETAVKVVLPAAISGIVAAFIVAISRAVGETMIVAIAAGAGSNFTFNPFEHAETMTGHIVRISGGDLSYDSIDYNSIFAIGLLLFFMTLGLNIISQRIVRRFREVYE
ncbi:MAG: phosphate ABC transporter permease subunit PstC [Anaerolineales bacterium]